MARSRVITFLCWLRDQMARRAARVGHVERRLLRSGICLGGGLLCVGGAGRAWRKPPRGAGQGLSDQSAAQCRTGAPARHRRERAAGAFGLPAADRRQPLRRPAGGAQPAARQHHPVREPETLDHRGDRDPDAVQRFQDRQQRPRGGTAGAVRPRGAAQCRPGRAARRRHRLYQRARQPVAGRSAARQRRVPAGNARHHPEAPQCRRRHADRHRAGRGAAQPRPRRSERRRGQSRRQPGDLYPGDRQRAHSAPPRRNRRPPAAAQPR